MPADLDTAHPGEARLRAALAAAASAPVDPAWDTIRSRVLGEEHTIRGVPTPRRWSRGLAVAAAVLVVALTGAVVAATRSASRDQFNEVGGAIVDATGWYVPVDLPEGWSVTSVTALRSEVPVCFGGEETPVRGIRWVRSESAAAVVLYMWPCEADATDMGPGGAVVAVPEREFDTTNVDLGDAGVGSIRQGTAGSDHQLSWTVDNVAWGLESTGLTGDELIAFAREVAADSSPLDVVPAGFRVADRWALPPSPRTLVEVTLTTDTGIELVYTLGPPGSGYYRRRPDAVPAGVDSGPPDLQVLTFTTAPWTARYGSAAPEVDLTVWARTEPGASAPDGKILTDIPEAVADAAEVLVRSLEPATREQWRRFLADAGTHTAVLDQAAVRADLDERLAVPAATTTSTTSTTAPP
ncbi:MAG TPA: hypothetical protein VF228_20560 [Iamia sp.]